MATLTAPDFVEVDGERFPVCTSCREPILSDADTAPAPCGQDVHRGCWEGHTDDGCTPCLVDRDDARRELTCELWGVR